MISRRGTHYWRFSNFRKNRAAEMSSVLRSVKKRKKSRRLGEVKIISSEEYVEFDLDAKVAAIRALVPLGLMHVQETLDQEVTALAGERYARKATATRGRRHGSNPGTVGLVGHPVPGWQDLRRRHDGRGPGDHHVRGETLPGLRGDDHRE